MVTNQQVRRLLKLKREGKSVEVAAARSGMSENTARKYLRLRKLPSQVKKPHTWRTREDPFEDDWPEMRQMLECNPGLEGTTVFEYFKRERPGEYADGQLRTLQRKIKHWRATEGPSKEVFFAQEHQPGHCAQSDFTHMTELGITIKGELFTHLLYHFVLPYSNWETGMVCFSENFESLSLGLQKALWQLGGVPGEHLTDRLTAAVQKIQHPEEFTARYKSLLQHYGMKGRYTQPDKGHEKGDVEQRHHRFKRAVDQTLMLRGSRDFETREEYERFLEKLFEQLNAGRQERLAEELKVLNPLPAMRLEDYKLVRVKVGPGSTIHVQHNVYSVYSRLIKEWVNVRLYPQHLEIWYGQRKVDEMPRLKGEGKHRIEYRHIIDWLVRKPGAFEHYRYREDLFPSTRFRMAYDYLKKRLNGRGNREYLKILHLAARTTEAGVDDALRHLINTGEIMSFEKVSQLVESEQTIAPVTDVRIDDINLTDYDKLLATKEVIS